MIREKRRRRARRKKLLIAFLVFLLLAAVAALVVVKLFIVKKVEVTGNELYTDEQIRESVLNDEYSWNSLYVVLKYKFFHTEEIPFIDEMEISLKSPQELSVKVYEKALIGYLEVNSQNVYFDRDGFVVEISKKLIEGVPRVEGIDCNEVVVYEKLNLDDEATLPLLLTFSQQLQKCGLVPETIVVTQNNNLTAKFGDIVAVVGNSDYLVEKVLRLSNILPLLHGKTGSLHLENWTPMTTAIIFDP